MEKDFFNSVTWAILVLRENVATSRSGNILLQDAGPPFRGDPGPLQSGN